MVESPKRFGVFLNDLFDRKFGILRSAMKNPIAALNGFDTSFSMIARRADQPRGKRAAQDSSGTRAALATNEMAW